MGKLDGVPLDHCASPFGLMQSLTLPLRVAPQQRASPRILCRLRCHSIKAPCPLVLCKLCAVQAAGVALAGRPPLTVSISCDAWRSGIHDILPEACQLFPLDRNWDAVTLSPAACGGVVDPPAAPPPGGGQDRLREAGGRAGQPAAPQGRRRPQRGRGRRRLKGRDGALAPLWRPPAASLALTAVASGRLRQLAGTSRLCRPGAPRLPASSGKFRMRTSGH